MYYDKALVPSIFANEAEMISWVYTQKISTTPLSGKVKNLLKGKVTCYRKVFDDIDDGIIYVRQVPNSGIENWLDFLKSDPEAGWKAL